MEYYETLKMEIQLLAISWMNLKGISAKGHKPVTKAQMLYDSTHIKYLK